MKLPVCTNCVHYFITYEPTHPHGCRAMNFKSAQPPSYVVYQNSGIPCTLFKPKRPSGGDGGSSSGGFGGIVA